MATKRIIAKKKDKWIAQEYPGLVQWYIAKDEFCTYGEYLDYNSIKTEDEMLLYVLKNYPACQEILIPKENKILNFKERKIVKGKKQKEQKQSKAFKQGCDIVEAMEKNKKFDIYENISDRIINALKNGIIPWHKPWASDGNKNLVSDKEYSGVNILLLNIEASIHGYASNQWATFKQMKEKKYTIKKGQHGTQIVYANRIEKKNEEGEVEKKYFLLKYYYVFNLNQTDYVHEHEYVPEPAFQDAEDFIKKTGIKIEFGCHQAKYIPKHDKIFMPDFNTFKNPESFYATLFHEIGHASGADSRLGRLNEIKKKYNLDNYAFEELVAEMISAVLCEKFGIKGQLQHESYIGSWIKNLENDTRHIFDAMDYAQNAVKFLTGEEKSIAEKAV